jgi:1,2-diacylglycerol 3-alpha-glucosyltransferase
MTAAPRPTRVYMPCTGLGHEVRGFETFTRECAAALRGRAGIELTVFGGGPALLPDEFHVPCLHRSGAAARTTATLLGQDPYFIEQATFFAGWLMGLVSGAPDLVYFADLNLGNALWHWRRLTGARFRLLFYNGGATTRPFTRCDHVQQVSPEHHAAALARGELAARMTLLPHGLLMEREWRPPTPDERAATRRALGVPTTGPLVLSVGALDATVKRMDAVIAGVAAMPERPHLLLLGAETAETPRIRTLAAEALPGRCTIATVSREMARAACRAADVFVLASLREGFGLALVEALAAGVASVTHATPTTEYLAGGHAVRANLQREGAVAQALSQALHDATPVAAAARHAWASDRFSWDRLAPRYVDLLTAVAAGRAPAGA